jgi:hypothetical protein
MTQKSPVQTFFIQEDFYTKIHCGGGENVQKSDFFRRTFSVFLRPTFLHKNFTAMSDISLLGKADAVLICVPRRMGRPVTRTWSTDFLLREGSSREEIGKWLKNKSIPWQRRRRLLQVVTGTFPCGQQMLKYGYKKTAESAMCKEVHEESGSSWNRELPKETIGHIQSAGCFGQKEVVTAAHNGCIRELLQEVDVHGKADRHMKLLTVETESRLGTLWDQEQCTQFCSKDELWEAAKEEEMKIPWKESE